MCYHLGMLEKATRHLFIIKFYFALFNNIFPTAELNTLFKTKYYAYLFQGFTKNIFIAVNTSYLVMYNKVTSSVSE